MRHLLRSAPSLLLLQAPIMGARLPLSAYGRVFCSTSWPHLPVVMILLPGPCGASICTFALWVLSHTICVSEWLVVQTMCSLGLVWVPSGQGLLELGEGHRCYGGWTLSCWAPWPTCQPTNSFPLWLLSRMSTRVAFSFGLLGFASPPPPSVWFLSEAVSHSQCLGILLLLPYWSCWPRYQRTDLDSSFPELNICAVSQHDDLACQGHLKFLSYTTKCHLKLCSPCLYLRSGLGQEGQIRFFVHFPIIQGVS